MVTPKMTDKEYLSRLSKIEIYAEILLGILRYTPVKNTHPEKVYKEELTKKLRFEKISDPDLLRACIDIIEDSQQAIQDFQQHGLYKREEDIGEMYLRLYGVLNASYLQMGAVIDLNRLFNMSNQKSNVENFKKLKLIEIRNKLGSHTTNYKIPGSKEGDFFKLAQSTLSKRGNRIKILGKYGSEEIDLTKILEEFSLEMENSLEKIVRKELFTRVFKEEHFKWLNYRYNFLHE